MRVSIGSVRCTELITLSCGKSMPALRTEATRPGAAGQHDAVAGDRALLGDDAGDAAGRFLDSAHGAIGEDLRAAPACRFGDGRWRQLRFGAAVIGRIERALPCPCRARLQAIGLGARDEPRLKAVGLGIGIVPGLARGDFLVGLAEIDDAALGEAGLGLDALVHAAPELQRFEDQWDLARVAAHLPAPAPIAARLLAADDAFFEERDGNAALGQFEGRRNAGDAAADDGDVDALGQGCVGDERAWEQA